VPDRTCPKRAHRRAAAVAAVVLWTGTGAAAGGEAPAHPGGDAARAVPLTGAVLSRGDRTPIAGLTVLLDDGALSTVSDADGSFAFAAVAPGRHIAHLRGPVVGRLDVELVLRPGVATRVTWYASRSERLRSTVLGRRIVQETVEHTLDPEEIKHIAGTQGDPIKAVQNLPGVARPPFNGGLVVVWGSAPADTRTYVDGVYIPTLFHFAGLRSTLNADLVSSLTFLPGGFGAQYGRGLGGAIELESRRPRSDGFHGFAQVDLIDLSAMVEGPLSRKAEFAVAGRVSWLDLFLPLFVSGDVVASPRYWDYQARLHYRPTARDDLDVLFFGSDDALSLLLKNPDPTLALDIADHTFYHRGLLRYLHRFQGGATLSISPSVGYDLPDNRSFRFGALPFGITGDQFEWNLRALARVPLGRRLRLDVGLDYEGTRFALDATQNLGGGLRDGDPGGFAGLSGPDTAQSVGTDHLRLITNHVAPFAALAFSLLGGAADGHAPAPRRGLLVLGLPRRGPRVPTGGAAPGAPAVGARHDPPGRHPVSLDRLLPPAAAVAGSVDGLR
jgi:hypothetical protein